MRLQKGMFSTHPLFSQLRPIGYSAAEYHFRDCGPQGKAPIGSFVGLRCAELVRSSCVDFWITFLRIYAMNRNSASSAARNNPLQDAIQLETTFTAQNLPTELCQIGAFQPSPTLCPTSVANYSI